MIPDDILTRARYLTKTSTTDGTSANADLLPILNDYYMRQATQLIDTNEDKFGVKSTTNLNTVANQEAYALPSDCFRVKRLEVTFDGTNWYKIQTQDAGDVEQFALDSTNINNNYSTTSPYADIFGDYIYLRPIPSTAVTNGLKIWYIQRPSLLSTISSTINTPSEYHGYLTYGVASEIATRKGDSAMAGEMFQKFSFGQNEIATKFAPYNFDYLMGMKSLPNMYT